MMIAARIGVLPATALALAMGACLSVLGVPATLDALISKHGALHQIHIRDLVSAEEATLVTDSEKQPSSWEGAGRNWTDLPLSHLVLAPEVEPGEKVRSALTTGFTMAPANPFAWGGLAYIETPISGPSSSLNLAALVGLPVSSSRAFYLRKAVRLA